MTTKAEDGVQTTFEQIEAFDTAKEASTGYFDETNGASSHNKSKAERRLVMKIDFLLIPLASLIYLVTSWVSTPSIFVPWSQ